MSNRHYELKHDNRRSRRDGQRLAEAELEACLAEREAKEKVAYWRTLAQRLARCLDRETKESRHE